MLYYESKARRAGFRCIAGVDEAGRGPLAGPVVAAALILKKTAFKNRIDDSKKLTPKSRLLAFNEILKKAWIGIGIVSEKIVDELNIHNATIMAMEKSISNLKIVPDCLLIDGNMKLARSCKKTCIVNGDSRSLSIACASIVAKVTRDNIMVSYHNKYPRYGFSKHKGYGTKEHLFSLKEHGPSPIHRKTFRPVSQSKPFRHFEKTKTHR